MTQREEEDGLHNVLEDEEIWKKERYAMDEQDERQLQDNDYEYASRTVNSWLQEAELRTMYPNELAALKFLLGRI